MIKFVRIFATINYNTTNGQYDIIRDDIINLKMFTSVKIRTRNRELSFGITAGAVVFHAREEFLFFNQS